MANFLSNLVQRFNQPTLAVQARPVSLFEPQTQFDLSPWSEMEQLSGESELFPTTKRADSLPVAGLANTPADTLSSRPAIELRPQNRPESPRERPSTLETEGQPAQLGYLVVRAEQQREIAQRAAKTPSEMNTALSEKSTGLGPGQVANAGAESHPRNQSAPSHQKATPSKTGPPTFRPIQPLGQMSIQPQIEHKLANSPTEPVINVTIGRVEVIAKTPETSTPPTKTKRPNPVMSLDEYLKSRDQERPR